MPLAAGAVSPGVYRWRHDRAARTCRRPDTALSYKVWTKIDGVLLLDDRKQPAAAVAGGGAIRGCPGGTFNVLAGRPHLSVPCFERGITMRVVVPISAYMFVLIV